MMGRAKPWNTNWTGIKVVDRKARPRFASVSDAHVVYVERDSIRGAQFADAHFVVAGPALKRGRYGSKTRVEVQCLWHGRKPKVTWMNVTCATLPVEKVGYTGEVITDFR